MTDEGRRVAMVTAGAGAGIGSAIVRALATEGYDVVITDAHERRTPELAASLGEEHGREFLPIRLDVSDYDAVGAAVEQAHAWRGRIDALVNSAGWNKLEPLIEMDPATWQRTLDVDLTGTFNLLRHVLPVMRGGGGGDSGQHLLDCGVGNLHRARSGLLGCEGRRDRPDPRCSGGVRSVRDPVNAIAPGLIYNDFLLKVYPAEFFEGYADRRSRVGRVGHPDDVAALAAFLLSEKAGYITGEVYGISGGVLPLA